MSRFEWDPDTFLATMLEEIPGYEELQESVAMMARGRDILELGTGTGETAVRILTRNSGARWTGIDASERDCRTPTYACSGSKTRCRKGRSILSSRCSPSITWTGREARPLRVGEVSDFFVLGDLVVAERPEDAVIGIDWIMDLPSTVSEQVEWLEEAGFEVEARYVRPDLAVFVARRQPASGYDRALRRKAPETGPSC